MPQWYIITSTDTHRHWRRTFIGTSHSIG